MILWMEGIHEEGQVCCYDFKVNLFSVLLIFSVAALYKEDCLVWRFGMRKVKFAATILR